MTRCANTSRFGLSLAATASVFVALFASCLNRTTDLGQPGDGSGALNPGSDPTNVQCDRRFYSEGLRITTPRCFGYNVKAVELQGAGCDKRLDVGVADLVWVLGKGAGSCHVTIAYGNGTTFSTDTVYSLVRDSLCGDYYKGAGHVADPASCADAGTCLVDAPCFTRLYECRGATQYVPVVTHDCTWACGNVPCQGQSCDPDGPAQTCPSDTTCQDWYSNQQQPSTPPCYGADAGVGDGGQRSCLTASDCAGDEHCDVVLDKCGTGVEAVLVSSKCTKPTCGSACLGEACTSSEDCAGGQVCGMGSPGGPSCSSPCCQDWGRCGMVPSCREGCTAIWPPHETCFVCVCPSCVLDAGVPDGGPVQACGDACYASRSPRGVVPSSSRGMIEVEDVCAFPRYLRLTFLPSRQTA